MNGRDLNGVRDSLMMSVEGLLGEVFAEALHTMGIMGVVSGVIEFMILIWLHLEDKMSCLARYIRRVEHAGVSLEAARRLVPATAIE